MSARFLALASLAVVSGCATTAKFEAKMNGFVGQHELAVIHAYGAPQSSYVLSDGQRALTYVRGSTRTIPGLVTTQPTVANTTGTVTRAGGLGLPTATYTAQTISQTNVQGPPIVINRSCAVTFLVDLGGIVRSWRADGNACVAQ